MDGYFSIGPFVWQLDLDQDVTEFYVDTNFVIRQIDWQLELDQGVTEFTWTPTFPSDQPTGT